MRRKRKQKANAAKMAGPAAGAAGLAATAVWRFVRRKKGEAGDGPGLGQDAPAAKRDWTCECGQQFRVAGEDRHRVFWLADADDSDPVLGDQCPNCEKPLSTQEAAV